jgi:hypothetical protein
MLVLPGFSGVAGQDTHGECERNPHGTSLSNGSTMSHRVVPNVGLLPEQPDRR